MPATTVAAEPQQVETVAIPRPRIPPRTRWVTTTPLAETPRVETKPVAETPRVVMMLVEMTPPLETTPLAMTPLATPKKAKKRRKKADQIGLVTQRTTASSRPVGVPDRNPGESSSRTPPV